MNTSRQNGRHIVIRQSNYVKFKLTTITGKSGAKQFRELCVVTYI